MGAAIVRQDIITWYTPDERMPEEDVAVIVTFSGKVNNKTFTHAIGTAIYYDHGWDVVGIDEIDYQRGDNNITIEAWCDLEPYGGAEK